MGWAAGSTALVGRQDERKQVDELIDRARAGTSGILVVHGEAGIGKTALLADAAARTDGIRTIWIGGAESEMELSYAGVQQLCSPVLAHIDQLAGPQKDALRIAMGLLPGDAPDRLLVGLGVLTLLAEAGAERPTVCIIDDAQWVDRVSLQALAFAARRLFADPVAMLFSTRSPGTEHELSGFPELHLQGLSHADAQTLLSEVLPGHLDETVRQNILAEAAGNPLALLELRSALPPATLAGGYGLSHAAPVSQRIEREYGQRLQELPPATRTLLLIAAAEPTGDPAWLWAAAHRLGVDASAAGPAERTGLITTDSRLRFRHPLVRSAVYHHAPLAERQRVHAALAEATSGPSADEYSSWHRAHSVNAPDEAIASDLVRSAERARRRGGAAAAAAFLAIAVELTPDPARRAERALAAALSKLDAGDPEAASRLLAATVRADDELLSARVDLLKAKIAFATQRGRDAPPLLLAAAQRLQPLDPALARDTYLEALTASMIVGRLAQNDSVSAVGIAEAALQAPPPSDPPTAADLFLDGIIVRLNEGHAAATPVLRRAITRYLKDDEAGTADPRSHDITLRVLLDLFEQDIYSSLNARQVELLRQAGELTVLPAALTTFAGERVTAGDFPQAASLLAQSEAISQVTGAPPHRSIQAYLAACRGQEQQARKLAQDTVNDANLRGEGSEITVVLFSLAILHNSLGQYDEAFAVCASALEYDDVGMYGHVLNEMVEAAARSGRPGVAADAAAQLIQRAESAATATVKGYAARATALTSTGPAAENEYVTAIAELEHSPLKVMAARTHLIYGEWLRRESRRAQAREQLRIALDRFGDMGADGFAERARRELEAAGEVLRRSRREPADAALTTQESYIARLAGDGYTNSEIAGHLFISPRTVEWHLGRVFAKLGVSSRRELRGISR